MKIVLKLWHLVNGKDVDTVVNNIIRILKETPTNQFTAYKTLNKVNLAMSTFNLTQAKKTSARNK